MAIRPQSHSERSEESAFRSAVINALKADPSFAIGMTGIVSMTTSGSKDPTIFSLRTLGIFLRPLATVVTLKEMRLRLCFLLFPALLPAQSLKDFEKKVTEFTLPTASIF